MTQLSDETIKKLDEALFSQYQLGRAHQRQSSRGNKRVPGGEITEAKQAILDWHNKQIEEVLDRLELNMRGKTVIDTADGWKEFIKKHVNGAIEAERAKLKEV